MANETDAQLTFSFLLLKITYVDVIYSLIAREKNKSFLNSTKPVASPWGSKYTRR